MNIENLIKELRGLKEVTIVTSKGNGLRYDYHPYKNNPCCLAIEKGSKYTKENSTFMLTPRTLIQLLNESLKECTVGYSMEVIIANRGLNNGEKITGIHLDTYEGEEVILFEVK